MPKLSALQQAILFIPVVGRSADYWIGVCHDYAERKGYKVVSIVRAWDDLVRMVRAGAAGVVVAGRREHLPRNRIPRIEFAIDPDQVAAQPPEQRRPVRTSEAP